MYNTSSATQLKNRKGKPWQMVIQGKDVKKKTKMAREAKGKKEAEALARQWMIEENALLGNPEERITVNDMVSEYLDKQFKIGKLEESSYNLDSGICRRYIEPYIGTLGFKTVDKRDLDKWITELYSKGLSRSTVYKAYAVLNKTYNYYIRQEEIDRNPCIFIDVPKGKPRKSYMTDKQMENLIAAVNLEFDPVDPMYVGIYLAYYGALRCGEICGLRWRDVDFETGTITISSAIGRKAGGTYTKGPKNETSYRTFGMVPQLRKALKDRYDKINPSNSWFVIGDEDQYMSLYTFSGRFRRFVKAYNLLDAYDKLLTPHSLRHNLGYMAIRAGVDVASLSKIFGHASKSITLETYSDTSPEAVALAIDKIGKYYKKNDLDE